MTLNAPKLESYCQQVCGGGNCGTAPVCMYGIDTATELPAHRDHAGQLARTMAFLWDGFMSVELTDDEIATYDGRIGVADTLAHWAVALDSIIPIIESRGFEYPSVFEYEVTEPLGAYLRKNGADTEKKAVEHAAMLATQFFLCRDSDDFARLRGEFEAAIGEALLQRQITHYR